jgi:hypothetical protein
VKLIHLGRSPHEEGSVHPRGVFLHMSLRGGDLILLARVVAGGSGKHRARRGISSPIRASGLGDTSQAVVEEQELDRGDFEDGQETERVLGGGVGSGCARQRTERVEAGEGFLASQKYLTFFANAWSFQNSHGEWSSDASVIVSCRCF